MFEQLLCIVVWEQSIWIQKMNNITGILVSNLFYWSCDQTCWSSSSLLSCVSRLASISVSLWASDLPATHRNHEKFSTSSGRWYSRRTFYKQVETLPWHWVWLLITEGYRMTQIKEFHNFYCFSLMESIYY